MQEVDCRLVTPYLAVVVGTAVVGMGLEAAVAVANFVRR